MELSKAKDIHVGGQAAKELWLGGRMVWAAMPEAIRQSMVLWYDLRRQGATNQSMAADPRLLDLSGNGHHATCQGFAWKGMSGVGGYYFTGLHADVATNRFVIEYNSDFSVVTYKERKSYTGPWIYSFTKSINIGDNVHYKIEVSGLSKLRQTYPNVKLGDVGENFSTEIREDGVYELNYTSVSDYSAVALYNSLPGAPSDLSLDVTIRQIPLYPHALVSDGVDDYALTDDIPAFSREMGFTVMAMRENTDPEDTNPAYGIGKSTSSYSDAAFLFDNNPYREGGSRITVFGSGDPVNIDEWKTCKFIALTPEKALAGDTSVAIKAANAEDSIRPMCLFITNKNTQYYRKSALYSLLLFDRSLSDDEIAWVRANLMDDGE